MNTLHDIDEGKTATINSIHGGCRMKDRLSAMGIIEGAKIKVQRKSHMQGPIVVEIGQSAVAIGFNMAQRIFIESDDSQK
jgi:ferrous iron transport protein A